MLLFFRQFYFYNVLATVARFSLRQGLQPTKTPLCFGP